MLSWHGLWRLGREVVPVDDPEPEVGGVPAFLGVAGYSGVSPGSRDRGGMAGKLLA